MTARPKTTLLGTAVRCAEALAFAACIPWIGLEAQAKPAASPADDYLVDVWTTDNGLPQNSVNEIVQTSDGYLWLATYGGLVRFDGVKFTPIPRVDSTGTHLDRIIDMVLAPGDTIWLAAESGLLRYAAGRFQHWGVDQGVPARDVRDVALGADGSVWLATTGGYARFRNGRFETVAGANASVGAGDDVEGRRWRARGDPTAMTYRERPSGAVQRVPTWDDRHDLVLEAGDGTRWYVQTYIGTVTHVDGAVPDGAERTWTREHGIAFPMFMVRDNAGQVWIGNLDAGVQLLDPSAPGGGRAWPVLGARVPARATVHAMFVDREGTLWIGTNGDGLMRIRRKLLDVVGAETPGVVSAILEHTDGRMLLGTNCRGLYVRHPDGAGLRPFQWPAGGTQQCATALVEGPDSALWVGGYGALRRTLRNSSRAMLDAGGREVTNVMSLYAARDGTVWAGRLNGGLYAFESNGTFLRHYGTGDGLGDADVRFITEDAARRLWIGTTGGLGHLANGRFKWFTAADGLPSEHVRAIKPELDGSVWIGTYGGGLALLRDGRFTVIGTAQGLADNVVSSILDDGRGNFWMSGNRGIFRVRRSELEDVLDGRAARVHSVLYGKADGMHNVETNGGFQPAGWRARDGRLWFPTLRGAAVIDPARAGIDGLPPPAVIEEIAINGVPHQPVAGMEIEPGRPGIEIRYTGLSLTAPEHIAFRYRLVGYDENWTDAGTRRIAYFPRLPPGDYRFEVVAANRDGTWGAPATLAFDARPAAHETHWFRAGLALLVVGGVAGVAHRRVAAARRLQVAEQAFSRALVESQESERRRIATELHDGLGQDLLLVKNYAALAAGAEDNPAMLEHVGKIGELATGALGSVRALAHTLTPRQLEHVGVTQAVTDMMQTVQRSSDTRFTVALDNIDDAFELADSVHIFRIVQEAVSNVLKHADARDVSVTLTRTNAAATLVIRDDGRGFDLRNSQRNVGGLGLAGIRQRAGILSGSLTVDASPGGGTCISVVLPLPLPQAAAGAHGKIARAARDAS